MGYSDFIVRYDPKVDTSEDLAKKIIHSIFIKRRIKARKPAITFIGGDSGEGKSYTLLALENVLLQSQGLKLEDYIDNINVYTPLQYPEKLKALLFNKELKPVNILAVHEARDVVKAKDWNNFVTQSIADVNAQSRSVKRLMIFIISQFIRDITTDIRYTLNYYCVVRRPTGHKARLYINSMWKDDRDLEKPKLRKARLSGYLVYPSGRYRRYSPKYLEITKPSKEIIEKFEKADTAAKERIIKSKLNKLMKKLQADLGVENKKIDTMVDYYTENFSNLSSIGKRYKSGWRVKPHFKEMHDLTKEEAEDFQERLNKKLQQKGMIENDNEQKQSKERIHEKGN